MARRFEHTSRRLSESIKTEGEEGFEGCRVLDPAALDVQGAWGAQANVNKRERGLLSSSMNKLISAEG